MASSENQNLNSCDADEEPKQSPWLKPWHFKPGQSGNPAGRPKLRTFEELVREVLAEKIGDHDKFEILARVVVDEAIQNRNIQVIKILCERLWPVSNVLELADHREPVDVSPPRTIEHMREVLRIANEVIEMDPAEFQDNSDTP